MNKFLRKYVVNRNIIYVQSSLSVHLWIASHFLLSIQSIPFSVSKKKHRHTTNHPFIMPRSRNGRGGGRIKEDNHGVDDDFHVHFCDRIVIDGRYIQAERCNSRKENATAKEPDPMAECVSPFC
jgi:hypothetical protein